MTHAERFALNQWLSDYPEGMTYQDILDWLRDDADDDNLSTWFVVEYLPAYQVVEIIEDTRVAFDRAVSEILKGNQ